MKKTMKLALCTMLFGIIAAGCSTQENSSTSSAVQQGEGELKGKIVMMTNSSGGTYNAVTEIVEDFIKQHPGVEIELSSQGSDYESLMKAKMAANDLPDVFATNGWSVNRYSEYLLPLNDQEWYENLNEEIIPSISDSDGNIYTLPLNVDKAGMIYNYKILEEIGCDIPKTWDDFLVCCEKAKAAGYTPIYLAGKDSGKTAGILNILFASFIEADNSSGQIEALKSGNAEASMFEAPLNFLVELKDNGYFNVDYVTADASGIPEKLAGGNVLFAMESNSTMADAYNLNQESTLGMMAVPTVSAEIETFLTGGEKEAYGVWKDSENQEIALELLNFMAKPENIEKVSSASGMPVSMKNAKEDLGNIQESYDSVKDERILNKFDRECFPNGMWSTMKTIGSALIAGDVTVEEASEMLMTDYKNFWLQEN
ncbi:MAG TPA: carbohydrate ABC transporter substrate-binding protein [Candidatus Cottocaccamicrobium excrementipullorum]|nr:carbohydrate ABC transporter substrate-binding protein [Candidatus Cottocaccamicrobium excrementipullorum]